MNSKHSLHPAWMVALLLAAVTITYARAATLGMVWDDIPLVVQNDLGLTWHHVRGYFTTDLWAGTPGQSGGTGYYRPLVLLSFAVDRAMFGDWWGGYHLHSVLWHAVATFGLFMLIRSRIGFGAGLLAATVFGMHPMQSEAVIWVAARNDAMAAAFAFGALVSAGRPPSMRNSALTVVLIFAGGLAKESVLIAPLLLVVLDVGSRRRIVLQPYASLGLGLSLVVALRWSIGVDGAGLPDSRGVSLLLEELYRVVGLLFTRMVLPFPLHNGVSLEWIGRLPVWRWAVGLGALCAWGAAGVVLWRRGRRWPLVGLVWTACAVAPVLLPVADKGLIGERYTYLAVAGVGVSLAALTHPVRWRLLVLGVVASVGLVWNRTPEWRSDLSLWQSAVRHHATPYTRGGLGHALMGERQFGRAFAEFTAAIDDPTADASSCVPALRAAMRLGRTALMTQTGVWAARRGCAGPEFDALRGVSRALAGDWSGAEATRTHSGPRSNGEFLLEGMLLAHRGDYGTLERLALEEGAPAGLQRQVDELLAAGGTEPSAVDGGNEQ